MHRKDEIKRKTNLPFVVSYLCPKQIASIEDFILFRIMEWKERKRITTHYTPAAVSHEANGKSKNIIYSYIEHSQCSLQSTLNAYKYIVHIIYINKTHYIA